MDFERAERRYDQLQTLRKRGELDEDQFRVEVAKLLLHDAEGNFWMLDPQTGTWFCNRGEGWCQEDPRADFENETGYRPVHNPHPRTRRRLWLLVILLLALMAVALIIALLQWPTNVWDNIRPTLMPYHAVETTIASPADGSPGAAGQQAGIESVLRAQAGLQPNIGESLAWASISSLLA